MVTEGDILIQLLACLLAHLLQVLAAPPGTHRPRIVLREDLITLLQLHPWVLPRDNDGAARLPRRHLGSLQRPIAAAGVVAVVDGGRRRRGGGRIHVWVVLLVTVVLCVRGGLW